MKSAFHGKNTYNINGAPARYRPAMEAFMRVRFPSLDADDVIQETLVAVWAWNWPQTHKRLWIAIWCCTY